jgi:16S rRNA (cytosine1402-N4)-methyltransferase
LILQRILPEGLLIASDRDETSLEIADRNLRQFGKEKYKLIHGNFSRPDEILRRAGVDKIDGAFFDLGISTYQLDQAQRGFSFKLEGFLDMRMDLSQKKKAYDIVNKWRRPDLENIIHRFGQERYSRRITDFIIKARPVSSTLQLSTIIGKAVGARYRSQKIHPATRTFQALRIAVNDELSGLDEALTRLMDFLNRGARVCVISFHSLEDRIVKLKFKEFVRNGQVRIITKKPLRPRDEEIKENARSRSARLRASERI